jgi:hypothetical protein
MADLPRDDQPIRPVSYDELRRAQARAEDHGLHGDALREVLAILCQPPRPTLWSGNNRKIPAT